MSLAGFYVLFLCTFTFDTENDKKMLAGRNRKFLAALAVAGAMILASCESNRWFQSEDTLNAKIQTTWDKIIINHSYPLEQWTFSNGKVYAVIGSAQTPTDIDTGNYSVTTTMSRAYLTITDFKRGDFNSKWEILELDGGILVIATDHGSGVKQLEFQEK